MLSLKMQKARNTEYLHRHSLAWYLKYTSRHRIPRAIRAMNRNKHIRTNIATGTSVFTFCFLFAVSPLSNSQKGKCMDSSWKLAGTTPATICGVPNRPRVSFERVIRSLTWCHKTFSKSGSFSAHTPELSESPEDV